MKVFVDTNVLMDFVFSREGCLDKEQQIFALDCLITCNKKDFKLASIPVYTPSEFCEL